MVRDLYVALQELNLQVEAPPDAKETAASSELRAPTHVTFKLAVLIFVVFIGSLFVFRQDASGGILYALACIGFIWQHAAASRFAGIVPGAGTPATYACTGPHVFVLMAALVALALEANLKMGFTFLFFLACVLAIYATYIFATVHWGRWDVLGADWRGAVKPALIVNTIVSVPLVWFAHQTGQPNEGSIYTAK